MSSLQHLVKRLVALDKPHFHCASKFLTNTSLNAGDNFLQGCELGLSEDSKQLWVW